jgi:hypothetical protein
MMRSLYATLVVLALAGCGERPKSADDSTPPSDSSLPRVAMPAVGQWKGELPAGDAAARRFTLVLDEDYSALMYTELAGKGTVSEKGTWSADGPAVTILLTERDGKPTNTYLGYDRSGRTMTPAAGWDSTLWGANGPPELQKK